MRYYGLVLILFPSLLAQPADLILTNGTIWTGEPGSRRVQAVAVAGNKITAVGTSEAIGKLATSKTRVIDLKGRFAMPGFNDAHIHFIGGSERLAEIDLTGICTVPEIQRAVAKYAGEHPKAEWITGGGWEYTCFPGGNLPTREQLDAAVQDRPVFLSAYDGHTGWANTAALKRAGITAATKVQGFGEVVKDRRGEPSGALLEGAQSLVSRLIPKRGRDEKLKAMERGLELLASLGVTSIQNANGDEETLELFGAMLGAGKLTVRTQIAMSVRPPAAPARIAEIAAIAGRHRGSMLKVGAVKFMLDGVIESHTAAMLDNYADGDKSTGKLAWNVEDYRAMVTAADKAGLQIFTHAIGDLAVRTALDAYEKASAANGGRDSRFRIEHIEVTTAGDLERFARIGVIASMEPIHAYPPTVGVWAKALGAERIKLGFAWRSLEKAGARLVFSSDWPASISVDPIRGLHNAVNRLAIDGKPAEAFIPEQRVGVESALRAYTVGGAYAEFAEKIKGAIVPGMLADMVILSADPFQTAPADLHRLKVESTIFDGRVIFEAPAKARAAVAN